MPSWNPVGSVPNPLTPTWVMLFVSRPEINPLQRLPMTDLVMLMLLPASTRHYTANPSIPSSLSQPPDHQHHQTQTPATSTHAGWNRSNHSAFGFKIHTMKW